MKAKEARKLMIVWEYKTILYKIQENAANGENCLIVGPIKNKITEQKLKKLGYVVDPQWYYGVDFSYITATKVSW